MQQCEETKQADAEYLVAWAMQLSQCVGACGCSLDLFNRIWRNETGSEPSAAILGFWNRLTKTNKAVFLKRGKCLMVSEIILLTQRYVDGHYPED